MEELLEDLVVTKDYGLRFPEEEPKVNQSNLYKLRVLRASKKNLLNLLF